MEELERTWLHHWHDVIDAEVGADSEFDFEEACDDPDSDFRMHFVTWDLSDEAVRRCFEVLPSGEALAERAIEMRSLHRGDTPQLSEKSAMDLFRKGLEAFSRFSDDPDLKKPIRVQQVSADELSEATASCDRVAVLLEDVDWNASSENSMASSFLNETLYQLAQSYDVADHIAWPLFGDPQATELYRPFATLALSQTCFPLLDDDGPVLFVVEG